MKTNTESHVIIEADDVTNQKKLTVGCSENGPTFICFIHDDTPHVSVRDLVKAVCVNIRMQQIGFILASISIPENVKYLQRGNSGFEMPIANADDVCLLIDRILVCKSSTDKITNEEADALKLALRDGLTALYAERQEDNIEQPVEDPEINTRSEEKEPARTSSSFQEVKDILRAAALRTKSKTTVAIGAGDTLAVQALADVDTAVATSIIFKGSRNSRPIRLLLCDNTKNVLGVEVNSLVSAMISREPEDKLFGIAKSKISSEIRTVDAYEYIDVSCVPTALDKNTLIREGVLSKQNKGRLDAVSKVITRDCVKNNPEGVVRPNGDKAKPTVRQSRDSNRIRLTLTGGAPTTKGTVEKIKNQFTAIAALHVMLEELDIDDIQQIQHLSKVLNNHSKLMRTCSFDLLDCAAAAKGTEQ